MSILEIQYCNREIMDFAGIGWRSGIKKLRENQHLDCVTRPACHTPLSTPSHSTAWGTLAAGLITSKQEARLQDRLLGKPSCTTDDADNWATAKEEFSQPLKCSTRSLQGVLPTGSQCLPLKHEWTAQVDRVYEKVSNMIQATENMKSEESGDDMGDPSNEYPPRGDADCIKRKNMKPF